MRPVHHLAARGGDPRRGRVAPDAITAALEAAKRLATEVDAEQSVRDALDDFAARDLAGNDLARNDLPGNDLAGNDPLDHDFAVGDSTGNDSTGNDLTGNDLADSAAAPCGSCGYRNRLGNRFCGKCGTALPASQGAGALGSGIARPPFSRPFPPERQSGQASGGNRVVTAETHHYHHHYHYFSAGLEGRGGESLPVRAADPAREADRMRPSAALRGDMSRAEAAVRRITQEWVLACNTRHLDDLLDLYIADALVLRSNYPPIRGAAAVREFFFGGLDAGLGDAEMDPLRVEIAGDLAYEAGRFKALVPGATGKRREERGKYLWVCARQSNGEWKLAADCWSSDLGFSQLESDVPAGTAVKTREPRKS